MVRQESDALGTVDVPKDAYYGVQTVRALHNFPITGQRVHPAFIHALGDVKAACAYANNTIGQLSDNIAQPVLQAAEELAQGKWDDEVVVDPIQGGAGTSLNMNVNEVIANRALEILGHPRGAYDKVHPNSHVNMSQSTNDVIPTGFRIALLRLLDAAIPEFQHLVHVLRQKAEQFNHVLKMGRTHLQDAVPIRLGQEFAAYADVMARDTERLHAAKQLLYTINIGATAVGTGLNADPRYIDAVIRNLSERTGYPLLKPDNFVDATQNIDPLIALSGYLKTCAVNLCKIANDLRLMASGPRAGLAEIQLPAKQPGSSIMPGKVNPVMPELINQIAFRIIGNDMTATMVGQAGQLELNVMQPVLFYALIESVIMLTNGTRTFIDNCLQDIEANEEYTRNQAESSPSLATALNPYLGYEVASEIALEALKTNKPVRDIVLEKGLLTAEQLDKILQPEALTQPRPV